MKVKAGKYSFDKIYLLPIEFVLKTDGKIMPLTISLLLLYNYICQNLRSQLLIPIARNAVQYNTI